jgi:hypothetical protein
MSLANNAFGAPPGPTPPGADRQLARDIFKELVETNTTHAMARRPPPRRSAIGCSLQALRRPTWS